MMNCPACDSKRLHAPEDWEYHPYAHHGWNGSSWTHPDLDQQPYIVCPKCGMVSHNPNDVRERYCGNCHAFHDDLLREMEPAEGKENDAR